VNKALNTRELGMYLSGLLLEIVRQFPSFGYPRVITICARLQGDFEGLGRVPLLEIQPAKAVVGLTQRD
jgi:hypothetical protein